MFGVRKAYRELVKSVRGMQQENEQLKDKNADLKAENANLRELLDFALPIAMYAASTEEGGRMRELMREVEL